MKTMYWSIGGRSIKLRGPARRLRLESVNRAIHNATHPDFMRKYINPRSKRNH